jgi:hypothetical protein
VAQLKKKLLAVKKFCINKVKKSQGRSGNPRLGPLLKRIENFT